MRGCNHVYSTANKTQRQNNQTAHLEVFLLEQTQLLHACAELLSTAFSV